MQQMMQPWTLGPAGAEQYHQDHWRWAEKRCLQLTLIAMMDASAAMAAQELLDTQQAQLLMSIGFVATGSGRHSQAEVIFHGLATARPESALPWLGLAVVQMKPGAILRESWRHYFPKDKEPLAGLEPGKKFGFGPGKFF